MASIDQQRTTPAGPDLVVPLRYFDNNTMFTSITMHAIMVYDDVLDAEKLHSSLSELIGRETWQRLGARLKKSKNGLDLHVPRKFSSLRPALAYEHVTFDMAKADHYEASRIPSSQSAPSDRPAILGNSEDWTKLCCGSNPPQTSADFVGSDRPITGLRIVTFKDATIIDLYWLHIAADGMALKAILDNWVLILQGREVEIPLCHDLEEDPLRELGLHPTESFDLAGLELSRWGTASYVLRNGYSIALGKKENRTLCIPARFLKTLRQIARRELKDMGKGDQFLTDNDIVVAWFSQIATSHLPPSKPVTIMQAMSTRRALEQDLLPTGKPYISNALSFTSVLQNKNEVDQSLGLLAADLRQGLNKHSTRAQIEAFASIARAGDWPLGPMPIFFGPPHMHHLAYSNWKKVEVHSTDFSTACINPRDTPLYPAFVSQVQGGVAYPEGFIITGQDTEGNYWLEGYRSSGLWGYVEKLLQKEQWPSV